MVSSLKRNGQLRWKPSYLRRQGQMTKAQKRSYRELWPKFGIDLNYLSTFSPNDYFRTEAPLILEIGFGKAETLLHRATAQPQYNYIACEVHKPSVAALLKQLQERDIKNIVVVHKDALLFLADHFVPTPLKEIWVFFPNPWPKDHSRRFIRPLSLEIFTPFLSAGTTFYCATDVEDYAFAIKETMKNTEKWTPLGTDRPSWRQPSKYEKKGITNNCRIFDLSFVYSP